MVKPMSPRRSPRLKGLSPAPKGPGPKPQRPKRVKNAAEDSVRQATYEAELAAWSAANEEHKDAMKIRKKKTMAAWKAAHKGAAKKVAPPPAAPPAVPPAAPPAALASAEPPAARQRQWPTQNRRHFLPRRFFLNPRRQLASTDHRNQTLQYHFRIPHTIPVSKQSEKAQIPV